MGVPSKEYIRVHVNNYKKEEDLTNQQVEDIINIIYIAGEIRSRYSYYIEQAGLTSWHEDSDRDILYNGHSYLSKIMSDFPCNINKYYNEYKKEIKVRQEFIRTFKWSKNLEYYCCIIN